jgi:PIN domain nuclease of toxin-antitoxin system
MLVLLQGFLIAEQEEVDMQKVTPEEAEAHLRDLIKAALPFHHRDPFDRLLIAQVVVEQIPLVSSDKALDTYGIHRLW